MLRFIRESFADAVDASANGWGHGGGGFVYQCEPSLRIHLPFTRSLGIPHRDYDYYHQPNEINAWIPLVPHVYGSNSLYCESAPGKGDFTAFDALFGSFVRFWGNQLTHFTVVNETNVTRVSVDVRVVPSLLFDTAWKNPKGVVAFQLGTYYCRSC